jgi:hypothetical protein
MQKIVRAGLAIAAALASERGRPTPCRRTTLRADTVITRRSASLSTGSAHRPACRPGKPHCRQQPPCKPGAYQVCTQQRVCNDL